jgi:hypothetical protein
MIGDTDGLTPEEKEYRRGLDDARKVQCGMCLTEGPPVWSTAAQAYFHKVNNSYKGCKSEFIAAFLEDRDMG